MKSLFTRIYQFITSSATQKASLKVAGAVVDRIGPHRSISKIGTVMVCIGIILGLIGWFLLSSWASWTVIALAAVLIFCGYCLRGFNSFLIGILARILKSLIDRGRNFIETKFRRSKKPASSQSASMVDSHTEDSSESPKNHE